MRGEWLCYVASKAGHPSRCLTSLSLNDDPSYVLTYVIVSENFYVVSVIFARVLVFLRVYACCGINRSNVSPVTPFVVMSPGVFDYVHF